MKMKMKNIKSDYLIILMPVIYVAAAIAVVVLVSANGSYPTGSDAMYHIYRGDYIYNAIKAGNLYPVYNNMWYNGVELMDTGHRWRHILWHSASFLQVEARWEDTLYL